MKIGNKLRLLRINAGLTQAELGKKVNLSRANISKYESDYIEPNLATLDMFAKIFGVSVDTILGTTNNPTPPGKENIITADAALRQFIELSDLSEDSRKDLLKQLELLKMRDKMRKMNEEASEELRPRLN